MCGAILLIGVKTMTDREELMTTDVLVIGGGAAEDWWR